MARRLDSAPPRFVFQAVMALREGMYRLMQRLVPARVSLFERFTGVWVTQMIYVAARLGLADHLATGPRTAADLAAASGAHADALARLLRALVSVGIFARAADGRFVNNRISETLRSDRPDSMRDIVMFLGSPHSMAGWARFLDAVKTGRNGFELANGRSVFDWFAAHPDDGAVFHRGMVNMTELDAPALVRGVDWSRFRTVCDVAGGLGTLLAAILSENPHLRGVLFDEASVVAASGETLAAWGVADRVTTAAGSFFDSVPSGCDAYVLKEILHDWDDARARAILAVVRRAVPAGTTLLVMEMVLVDDDRFHPGKLLDLEMLDTTSEGRQRQADEFARLFDATGFRLVRVVPLAGAPSIVEAVAV